MKNYRIILVFALIAALVNFAGCRRSKELPDEIAAMLNDSSGKIVRLGIYGDPLGLNPIEHLESEHGQMVSNFVHAAPLRKLADGSFVPYLFSEYYLTPGDNGTVVLNAVWRRGLKWHDGTEFDPRSLELTVRMMADPKNNSPYAELAKGVLAVSSIGQGQRCHMIFAGDSRQYLDLLCVGLLPKHILEPEKTTEVAAAAVASAAGEANNASAASALEMYADKPVGLGPYMIKAREKGSYLLLEANPNFFDDRIASRPAVLLHCSYDFQQLVSNFRQKKYDWINLPSMISEQLENMKLDQVKFVKYPNQAAMVWVFNTRDASLADAKVRTALDLLVDRNRILNQFPGDAVALYANILASGPAVAEEYASRFANGEKMLEAAGVKDSNNDGWRDINGNPFEIKILINDDNLSRRVIADQIVADLGRARVKAVVESVSWSDFVSKRLKQGEFSTALLSYHFPTGGNWVSLLHSSPKILDNLNYAGVKDEQIDKTLDALDSMLDGTDRNQAVASLSAYLEEYRPMAFLVRPMDVGLYHAEAGLSTAASAIWNDVLNWKLLFGPAESQL
ncbi:MAG TPA: ABC transporter substrate-binding protein [Candidatus Rifleibacterium sp.]|nr:ABC transporter substrate-binding protein [Candidatus Rifleibacterium sp.]